MTKSIEKKQADADIAFELFQSLLDAKQEAGKQFLRIGEVLTIINEKNLYKFFNVDNFEEFIAIPELGFARATARLFMHVFDLYIRRLGIPKDEIAGIQISKLQKIAPVVEKNPSEWLAMAATLSPSDLDIAVREQQGLPPREIKENKNEKRLEEFSGYTDFVSAHTCCVCNSTGADPHHFPISKGAGADDFKVMPLCRKCHSEYHQDPHRFILTYEEKIFDYFYETFFEAYKIISERKGQEV